MASIARDDPSQITICCRPIVRANHDFYVGPTLASDVGPTQICS